MSDVEKKYKYHVYRRYSKVKCSSCNENVATSDYHRHLKDTHNLRLNNICIWCLQFTWKRGDLTNFKHRYDCLLDRQRDEEFEEELDARMQDQGDRWTHFEITAASIVEIPPVPYIAKDDPKWTQFDLEKSATSQPQDTIDLLNYLADLL